ncbi:MAG: tRNA (adenosine(37)-N6)-threonylcarbamoyltransferase complex transferase subunit TsaD [Christensenellaceae bacterium]|nr:tRNA (adenosine(37)-N6)-threonylcarbamoyltransferase complex transferase subunit TsaD [Christensenellaceae bacterium]
MYGKSGLILGIESSCDETAAAVLRGGREVLSMAVHTQIPIHRLYGGVVPEIASRSHTERIGSVVKEALDKAGVTLSDIGAIAVTSSPGLIGALLVGVSFAKGLAFAQGLPLIGVNHIEGHIAANYLTYPDLEPPFMCLIASGGHSHIVLVRDYDEFELIGRTRDDAAGEAFDKVARALGLCYPGGPEIEKLAREGDPNAFRFHAPFNEGESSDFSFSGIKTAVVNLIHNQNQRKKAEPTDVRLTGTVNLETSQSTQVDCDVAASFQRSVVDTLTMKSVRASLSYGMDTLALAGGVSANTALRERLEAECQKAKIRFCRPEMRFCTDNAAMIACQGHYRLMKGYRDGLDLNPSAESFLAR